LNPESSASSAAAFSLADAVSSCDRVETAQRLRRLGGSGRRLVEFLFGHIRRIEGRTLRLGTDALEERRVVVEAIPRAVVDLGEAPQLGIVDRAEQLGLVAVGLQPEGLIHRRRSVDQQRDHAALIVAQTAEVGGQAKAGVLRQLVLCLRLRGGFLVCRSAGSGQRQGDRHTQGE